MDENNLEKAEKIINSLANLAEKLEKFPYALQVIYIVAVAIIGAFIYFMTRMIIEYKKDSRMERLVAENNKVIGACSLVMQKVCDKLEEL